MGNGPGMGWGNGDKMAGEERDESEWEGVGGSGRAKNGLNETGIAPQLIHSPLQGPSQPSAIAHRPLPIGPPTLLSAHATTHYMRHVLHGQLSTPQPRTLYSPVLYCMYILYVHTYCTCTCCTVTRWDYWCLFTDYSLLIAAYLLLIGAYRCLLPCTYTILHHTPAYYTILQHPTAHSKCHHRRSQHQFYTTSTTSNPHSTPQHSTVHYSTSHSTTQLNYTVRYKHSTTQHNTVHCQPNKPSIAHRLQPTTHTGGQDTTAATNHHQPHPTHLNLQKAHPRKSSGTSSTPRSINPPPSSPFAIHLQSFQFYPPPFSIIIFLLPYPR